MPPSSKATATRHFKLDTKKIIALLLILVFLYVALPQIGSFRSSLHLIRNLNAGYLLTALGFSVGTYFAAAAVYVSLAKKPIKYLRTVLVEIAGMFVNRILPSGIGAISVNYEYLRKNHHSATESGAVIAVNNTSGIIGHITLLIGVLIFSRHSFTSLSAPRLRTSMYWVIIAAAVIVVISVLWWKYHEKIKGYLLGTLRKIVAYGKHPTRLITAWLFSMVLTSLYSLCLWACIAALGVHITLLRCLIVLTLGVAGGTITPTPGGLVGAEAGLVGGLMLFGLQSSDALAIALTYRLLTYWLPLLVGPIAFLRVEKAGYI
jgi:uncharacterized membrane protein YbhN (UPF0104 family)